MAATTLTESPANNTYSTLIEEQQPSVYGCEHIESILKKHGDRIRREYDSAMSVVIQSSSKVAKAKVST